MADTFTPNLNLDKIEVGASDDTWGDKLNANADLIDAKFGATGAGTVVTRDAANDTVTSGVKVAGAVGTLRRLSFLTTGLLRWILYADASSEAAADNSGSDLILCRVEDDGVTDHNILKVLRKTGEWFLYGQGNFDTVPKVGADTLTTKTVVDQLNPIGEMKLWPGMNAPTKFLLAKGGTYLRADYQLLWAFAQSEIALGNTLWGAGNGTTTFTVPDMAGFTPIGAGGQTAGRITVANSGINGDTLGANGGEAQHTLTVAEIPSHGHGVNDPKHTHDVPHVVTTGGGLGPAGGLNTQDSTVTTTPKATGISIQNTGGGAAHNNVQPSKVINFIIRALP